MTYKEVNTMLASVGIDYAYDHFTDDTAHELPFICFMYGSSSDLAADNVNYQKIRALDIELYTANKDFTLEETVENILNENGFVYTREETYIDSEQMYEVIFHTSLAVTEETAEEGEQENA